MANQPNAGQTAESPASKIRSGLDALNRAQQAARELAEKLAQEKKQ